MAGLIIRGVPAKPGTVETLLAEWFGYSAVPVAGEWHIPENDPALRRGPADVLSLGPEIALREDDLKSAAAALATAVPNEFDNYASAYAAKLPRSITTAGGLGELSELHSIATKIAIVPNGQLHDVLETELLPFMIKHFRARKVAAVTVRAVAQQSFVSFAKLGLLAERFGSTRDLREFIDKANAFGGIALTGIDVLAFVDAMTRIAPQPFTLPVRRLGCVWHFYGDGFPIFRHPGCRSYFEEFISPLQPRIRDPIVTLGGLNGMDAANIWRMLREAVSGVNRLMCLLDDHRNFLRDDHGVDFLRQLQAFGATYLLFADLLTVNTSIDAHTRLTLSFGFLEKLANLRKFASTNKPLKETEGSLMRGFASLDQGKELKRLYKTAWMARPQLCQSLLPVVSRAYSGLHRHLGRECSPGKRNEAERLQRLWFARSLSHGTFLDKDGFEKLFLEATGTIPCELVSLPYLLAWGLLCDPRAFFQFRPKMGS